MFKAKRFVNAALAVSLSAVMALTLAVPAGAAGLTENVSVSDNSLIQTSDKEEKEKKVKEETVSADTILDPEAEYLTTDAFSKATNLKGILGDKGQQGMYGSQHTLMNVNVTDMVVDASTHDATAFTYKGHTYYFIDYLKDWIKTANRNGKTVTLVILVPYVAGKEYLIDDTALANRGNNTKGSPYFAPNVRGQKELYEAMFSWLAQLFSQENCHVDNWVLGNEVNMPNYYNFTGSNDTAYNVDLYAEGYLMLYNAVRKYTSASRVSLCLEHTWNYPQQYLSQEPGAINAMDYLNRFNAAVSGRQAGVDWSISYHMYPASLTQADIWVAPGRMPDAPALDLNPKSADAWFVDGNNLNVLTDYVKATFGNRRIMLTEQGFTNYYEGSTDGVHNGDQIQAASLAYSYYTAKYNGLVDCFIINDENGGQKTNFQIDGKLAAEVYEKLDNGNASDAAWIDSTILPIMGLSSWSQVVPNYGRKADVAKITAFVKRLYSGCLDRAADEGGLSNWVNGLSNFATSGSVVAQGFFFSDEFKNRNLSDAEYVEKLYEVMMGRASDAGGKADWVNKLENGVGREGVFKGFADSTEFNNICNEYGIDRGSITVSEGRDRNTGLTTFVARLYTKALGRQYEVAGLNDWCNRICDGTWSINDVSTTGFFNSQEFMNKNLGDSDYVKTLYQTFFDREYDQAGYDDWMSKLKSGTSRNDVLMGFCNSQEFANLKKSYGL